MVPLDSHRITHILNLHQHRHVRGDIGIPRQNLGSFDWGHLYDLACYVRLSLLFF